MNGLTQFVDPLVCWNSNTCSILDEKITNYLSHFMMECYVGNLLYTCSTAFRWSKLLWRVLTVSWLVKSLSNHGTNYHNVSSKENFWKSREYPVTLWFPLNALGEPSDRGVEVYGASQLMFENYCRLTLRMFPLYQTRLAFKRPLWKYCKFLQILFWLPALAI